MCENNIPDTKFVQILQNCRKRGGTVLQNSQSSSGMGNTRVYNRRAIQNTTLFLPLLPPNVSRRALNFWPPFKNINQDRRITTVAIHT